MAEADFSQAQFDELFSGLTPLQLPRRVSMTAWMTHVPFAFWMIEAASPHLLVELGTHNGVSFCAFCQQVAQSNLETMCYAVDTWKGDDQAGHYEESIFTDLAEYVLAQYAPFAHLVRSTFDEALPLFADGSIDLLHIDGFHSYEAMTHDFTTWLPKMSSRGIVLMHDINVRMEGYGGVRVWEEIKERFPTFSFTHGFGLGVVLVGNEIPEAVSKLAEYGRSSAFLSRTRRYFCLLGAGHQQYMEQKHQLVTARAANAGLHEDLGRAREDIRQAHAIIRELQQSVDVMAQTSRQVVEASRQTIEAARHSMTVAEEASRNNQDSIRRCQEGFDRLEEHYRQRLRQGVEQERLARLQHEDMLRAHCEAVARLYRDSRSWKLTKPLRTVTNLCRRLLGRSPLVEPDVSVGPFSEQPLPPPVADVEPKSPVQPARAEPPLPKVVLVSGEPETPQGHAYRITRLAAVLTHDYDVSIVLKPEIPESPDVLRTADVLWIWRMKWTPELAEAMEAVKNRGGHIVFDVDDLLIDPNFCVPRHMDAIRYLEVTSAEVAHYAEQIRRVMDCADMTVAPTDPLASHMGLAGKPNWVLPNGFDHVLRHRAVAARAQWEASKSDDFVRIGYATGTYTHQADLAVAEPALVAVLSRYPQVRLVLFRDTINLEEFPALEALEAQVEWRAKVPLEQVPDELARFDINIAPLEVENAFCRCKSELKFFEAALVGVPTVASPTEPFAAAIRHGETGFLAPDSVAWEEALARLVEDPEERHRLARNAGREVLWIYGPERRAEIVTALLDFLLGSERQRGRAFMAGLSACKPVPPAQIPEYKVIRSTGLPDAQVSVVIPLYNYEKFVIEALASLSRQTLPEFDVIVVDDCSTDASVESVLSWAERHAGGFHSFTLLQNRENVHLSMTRNAGIDFSRSEYVMLLDADNLLLPKCLEWCAKALDEAPTAAAAYPMLEVFGSWDGTLSTGSWNPYKFRTSNYIDAMAMIRKAHWVAVGGYIPQRAGWEDYELWCRFAEHGFWAVHVPEVAARYRVHGHSMLRTNTDLPQTKKGLVEYMHRLHPWLNILTEETLLK